MAYVSGVVSKSELEELIRRGWEVEPSPAAWIPSDGTLLELKRLKREEQIFVTFWVDANLFDVMNGPDWEKAGAEVNDEETH
jgi:hypothetical protein